MCRRLMMPIIHLILVCLGCSVSGRRVQNPIRQVQSRQQVGDIGSSVSNRSSSDHIINLLQDVSGLPVNFNPTAAFKPFLGLEVRYPKVGLDKRKHVGYPIPAMEVSPPPTQSGPGPPRQSVDRVRKWRRPHEDAGSSLSSSDSGRSELGDGIDVSRRHTRYGRDSRDDRTTLAPRLRDKTHWRDRSSSTHNQGESAALPRRDHMSQHAHNIRGRGRSPASPGPYESAELPDDDSAYERPSRRYDKNFEPPSWGKTKYSDDNDWYSYENKDQKWQNENLPMQREKKRYSELSREGRKEHNMRVKNWSPSDRVLPSSRQEYADLWYERRRNKHNATIAAKRKKIKSKRWEVEGNKLYTALNFDPMKQFEGLSAASAKSRAKDMLRAIATRNESFKKSKYNSMNGSTLEVPWDAPPATSKVMWGVLPVGPLLSSRLAALDMPEPLPIQENAFGPISQGENVVIGAETGAGKTLAFLVPLFTRLEKKPCSLLILVPSDVLAKQMKWVIDRIWPAKSGSFVHVVGNQSDAHQELLSIGDAHFLVGTPKAMSKLVKEAAKAHSTEDAKTSGYEQADLLVQNLQTVVIDEADELLNTVALTQRDMVKKAKSQGKELDNAQERVLSQPVELSVTEKLLRSLPMQLYRVQLVCASATVGRALRRQLQGILDSTNIEKAAVLVSKKELEAKDQRFRLRKRTPTNLKHKYMLLERKPTDDPESMVADSLRTTMDRVKPAPAIIFTGLQGIEPLRKSLISKGMKDVRYLRDAYDDEAMPRVMPQERQELANYASWLEAPVYIGCEAESRGLDLVVDYVFLMSPPSSIASYAHLAGRTGRNGRHGVAITLLDFFQAPNLVAISEQLEVAITPLVEDGEGEREGNTRQADSENDAGEPTVMETTPEGEAGQPVLASGEKMQETELENEGGQVNERDLSALTVADLKAELKASGLKVSGKKAELIERLSAHAAPSG